MTASAVQPAGAPDVPAVHVRQDGVLRPMRHHQRARQLPQAGAAGAGVRSALFIKLWMGAPCGSRLRPFPPPQLQDSSLGPPIDLHDFV